MNQKNTAALPRKRSRSLAQEVMNDFSEKIRRGIYTPGEKLPTEPEVMVEQGVSRTVVREAMSRLQATGLVETRHGVGTFVVAQLGQPAFALTPDLARVVTARDALAMLELRTSLETEAAGLSAFRRTDEDLELMRRAVRSLEEQITKGDSAVDADFQFHWQIALATGNKYFEEFYRHLGTKTTPCDSVDTTKLSLESSQSDLARANREHRFILDAIERKDPEVARASMRMHLSNSNERLRRASEASNQTGK